MGPLLEIYPNDILYNKVKVENVKEIVERTIKNNEVIEELLYVNPVTNKKHKAQHDIPFYKRQNR